MGAGGLSSKPVVDMTIGFSPKRLFRALGMRNITMKVQSK
jgi:hypothetical protein